MRNFELEFKNRVNWIKSVVEQSGCSGIVFGNSGGKDSALVGILSKAAINNVAGIIIPCESSSNFGSDKSDAELLSTKYNIETCTIDITEIKKQFVAVLNVDNALALTNINPRLRMIVLYTIAQSKNYLVAGTGNLSERTMGYFTKFGDGACDFNPIADLSATEVKEFLQYLKAPQSIYLKKPSAGLYEGQTDELDMGITYADLDNYILNGAATEQVKSKVDTAFKKTKHKRTMPLMYNNGGECAINK